MSMQSLYGVIPKIYGKGHCARVVADMILRMRREVASEENAIAPEIDSIILIDRIAVRTHGIWHRSGISYGK